MVTVTVVPFTPSARGERGSKRRESKSLHEKFDPRARNPVSHALVVIARAARDGGVVKATLEAKDILSKEGLENDVEAVEKLAGQIGRLAAQKGVPVEFGSGPVDRS